MLFQHELDGLFVGQVILDARQGSLTLVAGHRPPLMAVEDQAIPGCRQRLNGGGGICRAVRDRHGRQRTADLQIHRMGAKLLRRHGRTNRPFRGRGSARCEERRRSLPVAVSGKIHSLKRS